MGTGLLILLDVVAVCVLVIACGVLLMEGAKWLAGRRDDRS